MAKLLENAENAMSIATKTGDAGLTSLLYNRRVSKSDPRVEAYGSVDELNAALGLARATADRPSVAPFLECVQKDLVPLMAELATSSQDLERYTRDGFGRITPESTSKLDQQVKELEARHVDFKGWATPGATLHSAALEVARTTCRRAERRVCALQEQGELQNTEVLVYLNRLSDVLWLLARWAESPAQPEPQLV